MWDDLNKPLRVMKPTVWSIWNDFLQAPAEFIDEAFDVMGACPEHTFLILTKRPEKLASKIYDPTPEVPVRHLGGGDHLPNVYWGVTVEHQKYIGRLDDLLAIPGNHFVSIEPMLGALDIRQHLGVQKLYPLEGTIQYGLDAVIVGGETGPWARPMHPDWLQNVRDECLELGVPFFFKQWGGREGRTRLLDGREWNDLPWRKTDG